MRRIKLRRRSHRRIFKCGLRVSRKNRRTHAMPVELGCNIII